MHEHVLLFRSGITRRGAVVLLPNDSRCTYESPASLILKIAPIKIELFVDDQTYILYVDKYESTHTDTNGWLSSA